MDQFITVLTQIGIFLMLIVIGFVGRKIGIIEEKALPTLSRLVIKIALPAYIFVNTAEGATRAGLAQSLAIIPTTLALYLALLLLSMVLEKCFRLTGNRARVFRDMLMFGNVGFMGIPLIVELYPETGMLYISLFTIIDQALFWTYGVALSKPADRMKEKMSLAGLKKLLSPALIAIVCATVFVLLDWHLPDIFITTLTKLGNASMPLSLIYIGALLSLTDVRKVLKYRELYAEIAMKMLALPIVFFAVMRFLGLGADLSGTAAFIIGLPSISLVAMLCKANGSDSDYAVCSVMLTTIVCLATLPLISLAMMLIG